MEVGVGVFDELGCFFPSPPLLQGEGGERCRREPDEGCPSPALTSLGLPLPLAGEGKKAHPTIYAAPPVAICSPESLTRSMCATATRLPSRTTRPVAMKWIPRPGRR